MEHLTYPGSDHVPFLLRVRGHADGISGRKRRPWRINAHWIQKEECEEVIKAGWESVIEQDCFEKLCQGISSCQMGLKQWSGVVHNNPMKQIEILNERLHDLHSGPQMDALRAEGAILQAELEKVYTDEDIFWRQRSKTLWARDGDRNTSFFHAATTARKTTNHIPGLFNSNGVWCEDDRDLEVIITDYFGELFETSSPDMAMIDETLGVVRSRLTPEMFSQLSAPFTSEEVISALSNMAPLKSPGPDGLLVLFFHKYWHVICSEILSCVLDFLNFHRLPGALNYTFIVLIPKVSRPKHIIEFRPISLCNVVYKLGSKAIANRIKPFLNHVISDIQSAFIPGRLG